MNNKRKINSLTIILSFLIITGAGINVFAKGPHTAESTYLNSSIRNDVCLACHIVHGAKSARLWSQSIGLGETTGATVIQNLCVYCHYENPSALRYESGFYYGKYKAHVLARAHGQTGPVYDELDTASEKRHGPGHLYRSNTTTKYGDTVKGYLDIFNPSKPGQKFKSFDEIMQYANPDSTFTNDRLAILPRLSCTSCHDPHAEYIAGPYKDRKNLQNTYYGTADNYIVNVVGDTVLCTTYYTTGTLGRTRKVCLSCHYGGMEPSTTGIYYPLNADSATIIDKLIPPYPKRGVVEHYNGVSSCLECHSWDFPIVNKCGACHGDPPSANRAYDNHYPGAYVSGGLFPQFTIAGVGAHDTHFYGEKYNSGLVYKCATCHPWGDTHMDGTVEVVFDSGLSFFGGTREYSTSFVNTCFVYGTTNDKIIECVVGCHNPVIGETAGYINSINTVSWQNPPVGEIGTLPDNPVYDWRKLYSYLTCISCHEYQLTLLMPNKSVYPNASAHPYTTASVASQRNSCAMCHSGNDTSVVEHQWIKLETTLVTVFDKLLGVETTMVTPRWMPKKDRYNIYGDSTRRHAHTKNIYEWNPFVFNSTSTPYFSNPASAAYSSVETDYFRFPTRFGTTGIYNIYNIFSDGYNTVSLCDPCHDKTPLEISYGTAMIHGANYVVYNPTSDTTYSYRGPGAAAYFYDSALKNGIGNIGTTGIGGHGQSLSQVSGHRMGDSRMPGVFDERRIKCRSCHMYHGSNIGKILYDSAVRPYDVYETAENPPIATGNDNSFCYRCHFFKYDNGFYSSTSYELCDHGDTTASSNFRIWDTALPQLNYAPYATTNGAPGSYFWQTDAVTKGYKAGLCIYCHEPHGGYGWDVNVFDTPGFSGFIRAGSRGKYVDSDKYGSSVNLGDQTLCFKCHSAYDSWNVFNETVWSSPAYAGRVQNVTDWLASDSTALDISSYFDTSRGSHHRVNKGEQKPGALGNAGYLVIECINCHNPHKVIKDTTNDSVVTNLMYPFRPAEFMSDPAVTNSTQIYKVFNTFCLVCHDSGSEINSDSGNAYLDTTNPLWGKLPRGIKFSNKLYWGEGGMTSPDDTTNFHSWNKSAYYNSTGHGIDSTLLIGIDSAADRLPLANFRQTTGYGMACARIDEFACHDPHGDPVNISLLKHNVQHPYDTNFSVPGGYNYTTHIYDSTRNPADEPQTSDRWCAAACHQIGKRTGEKDWSHAFTYVRKTSDAAYNTGIYDRGADTTYDIDIYNTSGTNEPILNNTVDVNQDTACSWMHSSYNRVPGGDNNWTDKSEWLYDTNYKLYLPAKSDSGSRFVCFTCHDPHGTRNKAMIRYKFVDDTTDPDNSALCLKCHIFQ